MGGFTIMELLIVIGVLGILAVGLLAAIDPFEQLKKARDTNMRNASTELLQSLQRFYTTHGSFPWDMEMYEDICGTGPTQPMEGLGDITTAAMSIQNPDVSTCLVQSLSNDGELKETFMGGVGGTDIYIGADPEDKSDLVVCFAPTSKSFMDDPVTKYLINMIALDGSRFSIVEQTGVPPYTACVRQLGDCAQCFK